jgi:hypothetical protein
VVFHTAVPAYVRDAGERAAFAATVRELGPTWIAQWAGPLIAGLEPEEPWPTGRFALARDGRPVATVDPHGTAIDWLPTG